MMLREESGISDEIIAARGYRTVPDEKDWPLRLKAHQSALESGGRM
jgi:hypothetical protein